MRKAVPAFALLALLAAAGAASAAQRDRAWLKSQCGEGALAYEKGGTRYTDEGDIMIVEVSDGAETKVGRGRCPEFSPDSSKLAWLDGSTAKGCMRKGDRTVHTIATGCSTSAGVHWYDDDEVLVVKSGKWYRVHISGSLQQEVPALTALGTGGTECDVRLAGGVWCYVTGSTWKTSEGRSGGTGGNCACSYSPVHNGGVSVTGLHSGHHDCSLTKVISGAPTGTIRCGDGFDNQRWSSNDVRYVAAKNEAKGRMMVMNVYSQDWAVLGSSGADRGEFTVGSGRGDPWPGAGADPMLDLSPTSLTFNGAEGGTDPSSQEVLVTNSGTGTLRTVSTSVSYAGTSGWLSVNRSGSGNSQTLTNSVSLGSLAPGTHEATVEVSCGNASNSPRSYTATLAVDAAPAEPTLSLGASRLDFSVVEGGANPPPQSVSATNVGGGTLDAVTASVSYGSGSGWLVASVSGSGNGQEIANAVDISGLAAGAYSATVEVACPNASNSPATYAVGLAVTERPNAAPTVDAGLDQTVSLPSAVFLDGSAADDGLPGGALTVTWSVESGPGPVEIAHPQALDTEAATVVAGVYVFRLTADDGALSSWDQVTVTVLEEPTITLMSPDGGEVWYVGTTRRVVWTTVSLDDVEIVLDDGSARMKLAESVDVTDPRWGCFPVTVPDLPSTDCLVLMDGYEVSAPTQSASTFEIRAVTDSDSDGMDDAWETVHFGDLSRDGTGDADSDGLTDLEEFTNGAGPAAGDSDSDGMPDAWEVACGLDPATDDADLDSDSDGFTNREEYLAGTDPALADDLPAADADLGFACLPAPRRQPRQAGLPVSAQTAAPARVPAAILLVLAATVCPVLWRRLVLRRA
jgi:hypothetical protein